MISSVMLGKSGETPEEGPSILNSVVEKMDSTPRNRVAMPEIVSRHVVMAVPIRGANEARPLLEACFKSTAMRYFFLRNRVVSATHCSWKQGLCMG